jgi:hypothetical protein
MDKQIRTWSSAMLVALLAVFTVGCSDDESTACEEAENLEAAVDDLFSEETLEGGRDAVDAELDQVGEDLEALRDAADEEVGAEVDELGSQLGDVGDALGELDSDDLSGSADEVEAQLREAGDAWSALVDQVQASIEECEVDDTLE